MALGKREIAAMIGGFGDDARFELPHRDGAPVHERRGNARRLVIVVLHRPDAAIDDQSIAAQLRIHPVAKHPALGARQIVEQRCWIDGRQITPIACRAPA
jgi:hypothetical protein